MENKKNSEIWIDLIKDLIGFDRGYYFTLKAVYLNPAEVFSSYFENKGKYLSPFTLVGISFSIYYLLSGFFVDWNSVADTLKYLSRGLTEWEIDLLLKDPEKKNEILTKVDRVIVLIVNLSIAVISKYLIFFIFPIQFLVFYTTSFFSSKFGFGFYHHLVSFNYYFSFILLFINAVIILAFINIWIALAVLVVFNYFFYGNFFKSYGDKSKQIRSAFIKGYLITLIIIIILGLVVGYYLGRFLVVQ